MSNYNQDLLIEQANRITALEAEVENWRGNYILLANTINPEEDTPALDAAKALHTKVDDLNSYIDSLREEAGSGNKDLADWIRRIRARCDTFDWERQTLDRDLKRSLEDAWLRVSTGNINANVDTKTFPSNMMMFDHPRYSWIELNDLIKGIKR
jgi:hypothetical protein